MAAPTYIGLTESNTPASKSTASSLETRSTPSFSPSAGNVLVAVGISEDSNVRGIPPNGITGGPPWTQQQLDNTTNKTALILSTATASGGAIVVTLSLTASASLNKAGLGVFQFSGSDGIGNTALSKGTTGNPAIALTTTQDNSSIAVAWGDWAAVTGTASYSGAGTGTNVGDYADGTNYGIHFAYYPDAGATGAKSLAVTGITNPNWTIAVQEVKGAAGGGTPPRLLFLPMVGVGR